MWAHQPTADQRGAKWSKAWTPSLGRQLRPWSYAQWFHSRETGAGTYTPTEKIMHKILIPSGLDAGGSLYILFNITYYDNYIQMNITKQRTVPHKTLQFHAKHVYVISTFELSV